MRKVSDSFGTLSVEEGACWGAQTQRSLENFNIGEEVFPACFIKAYAEVKKAAALANEGLIEPVYVQAIADVVDEIVAGQHDKQFPLKIWQTGSGTQTNMNLNEVIAFLGSQKLEQSAGVKEGTHLHPNDHVNYGMSTNDSFPTAMHVSAAVGLTKKLLPALKHFLDILAEKERSFSATVKVGRTHLQDATPLTLGQEFSCFKKQVAMAIKRIEAVLPRLLSVPMGGTAVGTGLNSKVDFPKKFACHLSAMLQLNFEPADNFFEGIATHDVFVELAGVLNTVAVSLMKIANDIRLLASGPRCGLGELILPANEPGSSIMPGKVNPTQAEALTMVCAQVMGNATTISVAGSHGHLQLNAFKPVIIYNTLQSVRLLTDSILSFADKCVKDVEADTSKIQAYLDQSLMLVTALNPWIGYDKAAMVAKKAYAENISLKKAAALLGYLSEEKFDAYVQPTKMTAPGFRGDEGGY